MSQPSDDVDFRLSPRKSARTPKKKRRSESPLPSPYKKYKQYNITVDDIEDEDGLEEEVVDGALIHAATTRNDEIVLPCDEPTLTDCEEIYSSLPPDITIEQIVRVTRSAVQGEQLKVTRIEGNQLRIISATALLATSEADTNFHTRSTCQCVVCDRTIEAGEMFLNFPDDLDRRRIWGNLLGFRYQEMLRVKSRMVTIGAICTDHFAEECFRMYNFNKAAIEALGVPKHASPNKSPMKRRPWPCTICPFASYAPAATYEHIMNVHVDKPGQANSLEGNGYACPFCRRCTYGYKTLSGFRRHMMSTPLEHCHLKRVFELAREMCRSQQLEPVNQWSSWNEDNVALAYYGFIPPKKTLMGKQRPGTVPNSPAKQIIKSAPRPDSTSPRKETASMHRFVPAQQTVRLSSSFVSPASLAARLGKPPPYSISLAHSSPYHSHPAAAAANSSQTLADVLAVVGRNAVPGEEREPHSMSEVMSEPLDPAYLKKWMTTTDIRVSKRQIEAAQARARLFGDSLGPGDIPLPLPARSDTVRNSHQRLINVDKDVTAALSSSRPLLPPVSTVMGRPRVNILRPKPAPIVVPPPTIKD